MIAQRLFTNRVVAIALASFLAIAVVMAAIKPELNFAHAADGGPTGLFLRIDGIAGDSQALKHQGDFEAKSFSWEESNKNVNNGGGGGMGKPTIGDLVLIVKGNKNSQKFLQAVASGEHYKSAVLVANRNGGSTVRLELQDVLVTSYRVTGVAADGETTDQLSLSFKRIIMEYIDADGVSQSRGGWDFNANKRV